MYSIPSEEIVAYVANDNEVLRSQEFTIEAWIKVDPDLPLEGTILCQRFDEERYSWLLMSDIRSDRISFYIETEDGEEHVDAHVENLNNNDWHYVAVSYDGEYLRMFVDDAYVEWEYVGSPVVYGDGELIIGGCETVAGEDGQFYGWIDEIRISSGTREEHSVPGTEELTIPTKFEIAKVFPNPFNSLTSISYTLPYPMNIELGIYDLRGRKLQVLTRGTQAAGAHSFHWDARGLPAGSYLVRMKDEDGGMRDVKKVVLVK